MKRMNARLQGGEIFHNRYRVISVIGHGGMGTVYLAEDMRLRNKHWAIKEILINKEDYQQFIEEAKILVSLDHPYLPNIIDYYPPDLEGYSYLVMDYINGKTLTELFNYNNRILMTKQIIKYALQLCDLFDYLHNQQPIPIIYRDLKPSNIMIDEQDNVRLIDFGIARNYKDGKLLDTIQMGTIGFAAPEQFGERQTDHRADIYSLGALLYFLFSNGHFYHTTQKSIGELRNDLSINLVHIIMKMLQPNPEERYQNILEVKRDFNDLINFFDSEETELLSNGVQHLHNRVQKQDFESSPIYHPMYSSIPTKLIGITSLSRRAGSTFLTVNIAKFVSELDILTSVVEPPFSPYLFDHIGLDKRLHTSLNQDYIEFYSLPHVVFEGKKLEKEKEIVEEGIIWKIADPKRYLIDITKWNYQHMLKLLYSNRKENVTFFDIGEHMNHESIYSFLDEMDLILVVIDPMPTEIMINNQKIDDLVRKKNEGAPIEFVVNNWTNGINKSELIEALRIRPISFIPHIDLSYIHKAIYQCTIPYSSREVRPLLEKPLTNIVQKIIPSEYWYRKMESKKNWIDKLVKRSK